MLRGLSELIHIKQWQQCLAYGKDYIRISFKKKMTIKDRKLLEIVQKRNKGVWGKNKVRIIFTEIKSK